MPAFTPQELASLEIERRYAVCCVVPSDINEHLPVLRWLASKCVRVREFGVRTVVSTWAFVAADCDSVESFDINTNEAVEEAAELCSKVEAPAWRFFRESTLDVEPRDCGMLFIDTLHVYAQLKAELARHAGHVLQFIAMHDTETFGERGEDGSRPGLKAAVNEFLASDEGLNWEIALHRTNNNGLTVLRRIIPA